MRHKTHSVVIMSKWVCNCTPATNKSNEKGSNYAHNYAISYNMFFPS